MLLIADTHSQRFCVGGATYPMALGKTGAVPARLKREGDGKTPLGRYTIEYGFYRADRMDKPPAGVHLKAMTREQGWCDAPSHPSYNREVVLPFGDSHETMWRDDGLYDLVFVLSHNRWPAAAGYGSAIFLHTAKWIVPDDPAPKPTLGCIALALKDLLDIAPRITRQSWLLIR